MYHAPRYHNVDQVKTGRKSLVVIKIYGHWRKIKAPPVCLAKGKGDTWRIERTKMEGPA